MSNLEHRQHRTQSTAHSSAGRQRSVHIAHMQRALHVLICALQTRTLCCKSWATTNKLAHSSAGTTFSAASRLCAICLPKWQPTKGEGAGERAGQACRGASVLCFRWQNCHHCALRGALPLCIRTSLTDLIVHANLAHRLHLQPSMSWPQLPRCPAWYRGQQHSWCWQWCVNLSCTCLWVNAHLQVCWHCPLHSVP